MKKYCRTIRPYDIDGIAADNLAGCSCYMCGNPRRHFNELTIDEQNNILSYWEMTLDITNSVTKHKISALKNRKKYY